MDTYEIITGACEQNLFTEHGHNHRSYLASDGNWYTGVDSWDCEFACSSECRDALMAGEITVAENDLPISERTPVVAVTVLPQGYGYTDLTAYEIAPGEIASEQLPAICGHCETVIRPSEEAS